MKESGDYICYAAKIVIKYIMNKGQVYESNNA